MKSCWMATLVKGVSHPLLEAAFCGPGVINITPSPTYVGYSHGHRVTVRKAKGLSM